MANIIRLGGGYQAGYDDGNTDGYNNGYNSAKNQFVATYLGTGTSFNVRSKFPNEYGSFTADNFICEASGEISYGGGHGDANGPGTVNTSGKMTVTKSYNSSNGVLTAYITGSAWSYIEHGRTPGGSGNLSVSAYLVRAKQ